jgi:cytochrome b involved in lipid metabolism
LLFPPTLSIMSDVKKYTLTEVAKHKTKDDLWFVIHGKVYDVTKFGDDHPGGGQALVDEAGTDATNAFEDIGHSQDARDMLAQYYIGDLEVSPVIPSALPSAQVPPQKDSPTPEPTYASTPSSSPGPSPSSPPFFSNPVVRGVTFVAIPLVLLFVYQRFYKH